MARNRKAEHAAATQLNRACALGKTGQVCY